MNELNEELLKQFRLELDNYIPKTNNVENIRWLEERGFIFRNGVWELENKGRSVGYKLTAECVKTYGLFVVDQKTVQPLWEIKVYKLERNPDPPISNGQWDEDYIAGFEFSGSVELGFAAVWDHAKEVIDAMRNKKQGKIE